MSIKQLSTADVARQIGCDKSTISRHARKHKIGAIVGTSRVFIASDVPKLRKLVQAGPGCPSFVAGNDLGKRRKKVDH